MEQRREAPTEREAREVILRCKAQPYGTCSGALEALTEREAREVILRGIDAQCNKRSPLVIIIISFETWIQEPAGAMPSPSVRPTQVGLRPLFVVRTLV